MIRTLIRTLVLLAAVSFGAGCGDGRIVRFEGRTMGTTFHIKVVASYFKSTSHLKKKIEQRLLEINKSMSTYRPDSEISRFNNSIQTQKPICISDDFYNVLTVCTDLYQMTRGAWDGTVRPLVTLWGFSRSKPIDRIPTPEEINNILRDIGFDKIIIQDNRCLVKTNPKLALDLGSIAKGFGVDQIAALLRNQGFDRFLVEIGGEVAASGVRPDGRPWRIGVNTPLKDAALDQVYQTVELIDQAMATSGDYRRFFEKDGRRYSHVIDPRTGYPVRNGVVSASVMAANCTLADGLATALMVMGVDQSLALVERLEKVECLLVTQSKDGRLHNHYSSGFRAKD